jgi:predicted choloylglycine hydrolase
MSIPQRPDLDFLPVRADKLAETDLGAQLGDRSTRFISEPEPGAGWLGVFESLWPSYRAWYLKDGLEARPDLETAQRMLKKWMPELVPTFAKLAGLACNDPLAACFLSMYNPPAYVVGCSQGAFNGDREPVLVRNYDYPAARTEGVVYETAWTGRRVIGTSDCLWGLVDGVNDAGLAASLTFGGSPAVGTGFGIPLVLRYVLEVCETVEQACVVLARIPVHAAQNVTLIDAGGDSATVRLGPQRDPEILNTAVATNHQHPEDWPQYAAAVDTYEREHAILELVHDPKMTNARLTAAFLEAPLYREAAPGSWGTLFTASYFPAGGRALYSWPRHTVEQSFACFTPTPDPSQAYDDALERGELPAVDPATAFGEVPPVPELPVQELPVAEAAPALAPPTALESSDAVAWT